MQRKTVILHEVTAQKILSLISENKLQQGDKLPAERELAKQLGISRTSLRETLQTLEANNIVQKEHGSGVYVDIFDESLLHLGDNNEGSNPREILLILKNLVQAREMVETFGIMTAAKAVTPEQIEQFYLHEDEEYTRLSSGRKNSLAPGLDFEHCIISMLNNPVITNIHKRLNSSWKSYMAAINAVAFTPLKRHKDHMAIIHAIESQNTGKLEKAIHQHHFQTTCALNALLEQLDSGESSPQADMPIYN